MSALYETLHETWPEAVDDRLTVLEEQIDWNIRRLGNLVLSDRDREQIEDHVMALRHQHYLIKRGMK